MISFSINKFRREIWFSKGPSVANIAGLNFFKQSATTKKLWGFKQEDFFTKIVDLTLTEKEILDQFNKTTKYDAGRAVRDNIQFQLEENAEDFISFYNEFAKSKGLLLISNNMYFRDPSQFQITEAVYEGETLVLHSYLTDATAKRVRLLHSASLFRKMENSEKQMAGRANRFLHYQDMLFFKEKGFVEYDLGGYAKDTTDEELLKINAFKECFGGVMVHESNYIPYLYILLKKLKPS